MKARLQHRYRFGGPGGAPGWRLSFGYDRSVIEQLKRKIPHTDREWVPEDKEWWVSAEREDKLLALFPEFEAFLNAPVLPGFE